MHTSITKRGQTVIPADIRKRYHIKEGDRLVWLEDEEGIKVIPVPKDSVAALRGSAQGKGLADALRIERQRDREHEG